MHRGPRLRRAWKRALLAALNDAHPFIRRIEKLVDLSDEDREVVRRLPMHVATIGADQDLARQGDRPSRCCLILEGFAAVTKTTSTGQRQIVNFSLAGDFPDLMSVHLRVLDTSISTLTRCQIGFVQHQDVRKAARSSEALDTAFWRSAMMDYAIVREWVANIGQREAYPRLAHLLCEVVLRLRAIGLAPTSSCAFPFTQTELGEATGMTAVHVNRTLQALRTDGIISLGGGRLDVHDWDKLRDAAGFDPIYLHLNEVEHWDSRAVAAS